MTNTPESDTMKDNQMNERKLFEEFYKTITPAVPQAGYEDITMDAAYLAWKARAKQAEDGFQVTMSNTPMYKQAYDLIQSIESLGASPELTAVVTQAGKLMDEILKREMNFHHVCKAFNEINAPTFMGEPNTTTPQEAISPAIAEYAKELEKTLLWVKDWVGTEIDQSIVLGIDTTLASKPTGLE
jgi:hypothetical protein